MRQRYSRTVQMGMVMGEKGVTKMKSVYNEQLFIEAIKDGYLRIDDAGRIWRITRRYRANKQPVIPKREMKTTNEAGYIRVGLGKNGKVILCYAHRVVWTYFNGEIPSGLEMNHINGVRTDNRPENLELVTHSENIKHAFKNIQGEKCNFE